MVFRLRSALRSPEVALAVLAFGTYAYFFQAGGWNQNSRFALVRAIVEGRTLIIEGYAFHTGDYATRDGHVYCDKAPGLSALAVPVWAAVHTFAQGERPRGRLIDLGAYLSTLLTVSLPSAIAVALVHWIAVRWGAPVPWAAVLAVSYAFATLAFPYGTLFYSHQLVAGLTLAALALVVAERDRPGVLGPGRLVAVGLLLGFTIASEYPSAIAVAVLGLYAAWVVRLPSRWLWIAAGAALPLVALGFYHQAAFGSPFVTGYDFTQSPGRVTGVLPGVTLPDPALLPNILFLRERGLIRHAPWLGLAAFGAAYMVRSRATRAEGLACVAMIVLFIVFNCAQTRHPDDWRGGASVGPRYLVTSLPFYALAMAALAVPRPSGEALRRRVHALALAAFASLVVLSAARMFVATAVHPEVNHFDDPFADHLWPLWRDGQVAVNTVPFHAGTNVDPKRAWNLGERMGLAGRASLLPLAGWVVAAGGWLTAVVLRRPRIDVRVSGG